MAGDQANPPIPMHRVIAHELEIIGSHGMQAYRYPEMMAMILSGKLAPEKLLGKTISLEEGWLPESISPQYFEIFNTVQEHVHASD